MAEHNELGFQGEAIAVDYLQKQGYTILERNYRFKQLEVDVIAQLKDLLVVVEVKTRVSEFMAGPAQTVTKGKQKSIIKVANYYIEENEVDLETRFDIISIILNEKQCDLEHFEDAFYPTL